MWRVFQEECPGPSGLMKVIMTGTFVSRDDDTKLWLLRYRSFGQILTKIAMASDEPLTEGEEVSQEEDRKYVFSMSMVGLAFMDLLSLSVWWTLIFMLVFKILLYILICIALVRQ